MIIMYKGLPGSGKTRDAKKLVANSGGKFKRINKDDLRNMLDAGAWSNKNEQYILRVRDQLIVQALLANKTVLIDDTNLHPKHEQRLREFADKYNCEFTIKDFTLVSVDECIKRDLQRDISVGEKVIKKMWHQFIDDRKPKLLVQDMNLPMAIQIDLDGTLAIFGNKNPYNRDFINDKVCVQVKSIIFLEKNINTKIIILSGRSDKFKSITIDWLNKNDIPFDELHMRREKDNSPDTDLKEKLFKIHCLDKYYIKYIIDDRLKVVNKWKELGLFVFNVGNIDDDF